MFERNARSVNSLFALPHIVEKMLADIEPTPRPAAEFVPPVDVVENETEVRLVLEVPGLDRASMQVTLENGVLTVAGDKVQKLERKDGSYYRTERRFGKFNRTFRLSERVDSAKIEARYNDGLLEIVMPKTPEAQPRKIEIKA